MSKIIRKPLSPDRALVDPDEDLLGYSPFAKHLAHSILRGSPAEGLVVALYGAWGTGKSTVLNFILRYVEDDPDADDPIVVRFNPWWFSGQEDLLRRFFGQFEAAVFSRKAKRRKLLKKLSAFGSAVSELPIPHADLVGKVTKAAADALQRADVVSLKEDLARQLAAEALRILIVIDDVDRLAPEEMRQLMQLVKAVADFPNTIYLLAFDPIVVARALAGQGFINGHEFLEKIVQVSFTLPPPDRVQLQTMLFARLDPVLDGTPSELFDRERWGNTYLDGIDPFIDKPRDVVRLANALTVTYPAVRGEVDAVDFVGIEALRIFAPSTYETIRDNSEMFSSGLHSLMAGGRGVNDAERRFHDAWLQQLPEHDRESAKKLVRRLFPRLESVWSNTSYGSEWHNAWRKAFRVCSAEIFPVYFRLGVQAGEVSAEEVRNFILAADDAAHLANRLRELSTQTRPDGHSRATSLLTRLADRVEKDVPNEAIQNIVVALLDAGDDVLRAGKAQGHLLDLGDDWKIGWVLHPLLKRIPLEQRLPALKPSFEHGSALVLMVLELAYMRRQHNEEDGKPIPESDRLLPLEDLTVLQECLLKRILQSAKDGSLWTSVRPITLLDAWAQSGDETEMRAATNERLRDDGNFMDFLRRLSGQVHRRAMGDHVGRVTITLDPERVARFMDVEVAAKRVESLRSRNVSADERAVLDAFVRGRKARQAGRDPSSLRIPDGDDDD